MPIYQNKNRDSLLFVNRKVGVTSAKAHAARGEIIFFLNPHTTHCFCPPIHALYKIMIVRSPYLRIESFYKSKFFSDYLEKDYKSSLRVPTPGLVYPLEPPPLDSGDATALPPGTSIWERNFRATFPRMPYPGPLNRHSSGVGMDLICTRASASSQSLAERIGPGERRHGQEACKYFLPEDYFTKNINFEQFIMQGIKKGYRGHDHLYEQVRPLDRCQISVSDLNEIIKLEDPNFENLNKRFNINFVHENKSIKAEPLLWTTKMRNIVYERYKRDFKELGYEK